MMKEGFSTRIIRTKLINKMITRSSLIKSGINKNTINLRKASQKTEDKVNQGNDDDDPFDQNSICFD
jgi:hypothetical protein